MKLNIIKSAGNIIGKAGFKIKAHSPEILLVAGVVGTVASTVMACKATPKASKILDEAKENVDKVHLVQEQFDEETYSKQDATTDLAKIYTKTGVELVKTYAPAVGLGVLSLACILTSNKILRARNASLAAAYAVVDKGFKEYRSRVVERFGEQTDKELKHGLKSEKITEIVVDEETGKEHKIKNTVEITDYDGISDFARFYDDGCRGWVKDAEMNMAILKGYQQNATDLLRIRGHLFLNEVYDMLGLPRSSAGQTVGWVYDEEDPLKDNYVDFGLYDYRRPAVRDFVNGYERVILLDFNVDGDISYILR